MPHHTTLADIETSADFDESAAHEESVTFAELGVPGPLVRVLNADDKTTAFPIQRDTLPDSLSGRDVLGRGRTGSGKTLAFSIPLVARLGEVDGSFGAEDSMAEFRKAVKQVQKRHRAERMEAGFVPHPRGLVLAPTRELANQINDVLEPLANIYGISTTTVYGGVRYSRQIGDLKAGADIVVACPGRLEDLLEQGALTLDAVQIVIIDEADEMADMGFLPPIKRLLSQIRPNAQHMLFSATLDHGVDAVVNEFLHDPIVHSVDEANAHVDSMTHHVFVISRSDKPELVRALASGTGRRILFTRTKFQAKKLAKSLTQQGIPAAELHGNLSQNQRDRNLAAFEQGNVNVLVATDVAARGIDVSGVDLVVQVDPPEDPKAFLHRSGRTARAGREGDVITIMTPDQRRYVKSLLHRANIDAKPHQVNVNDDEVIALIGEVAEPVFGWDLDKTQPAGNPRNRRNRHEGRGSSRPERNNRGGRKDRGRAKPQRQETEQEREARLIAERKAKKDRRRMRAAERLLAQGKPLDATLAKFHAEHVQDWTDEASRDVERGNAHSRKRRNAQKGHASNRNGRNDRVSMRRDGDAFNRDERSESAKRQDRRKQAHQRAQDDRRERNAARHDSKMRRKSEQRGHQGSPKRIRAKQHATLFSSVNKKRRSGKKR